LFIDLILVQQFRLSSIILIFISIISDNFGILFNNLEFLFINLCLFDILWLFNLFGTFLLIWVYSFIFGYILFSSLSLSVSILDIYQKSSLKIWTLFSSYYLIGNLVSLFLIYIMVSLWIFSSYLQQFLRILRNWIFIECCVFYYFYYIRRFHPYSTGLIVSVLIFNDWSQIQKVLLFTSFIVPY